MKSMDYYKHLDLPAAARHVPADAQQRQSDGMFHDLLKSVLLRFRNERFTAQDLLMLLGTPDAVQEIERGEVWEYRWRGKHMGHEYRGADSFVLIDGQVTDAVR